MGLGLAILLLVIADWVSLALLYDVFRGALGVGPFLAFGLVALWIVTAAGLGLLTMTLGGYREVMKGWQTAARLQRPDKHFLDASLMLVAGILLLIPGVTSDALALLVIFPGTRWLFRPLVRRHAHVSVGGRPPQRPPQRPPRPRDEPPKSGGSLDVDDYRVE